MNSKRIKTYARFARQHGIRFLKERAGDRKTPIPAPPSTPVPQRWTNDELTVSWLGHATVLINFYGTWLLTDPALRPYIGVRVAGLTIGPRRLVMPGLAIDQLPPVDAVILSHAHMDHSDLGTLRRLPRGTHAVVQSGNKDLVRRFRRVSELGWGDAVEVNGATIEAIEVNHWGARALTDRHRGYGGFLITKNNRAIVFGGDTAYTPAFARLAARFSSVDLAILPIGAYDPFIHAHSNPEQAWQMRAEMNARYILPMHHSTFRLSREPVDEPIMRLLTAAGEEAWRISLTRPGETWVLPQEQHVRTHQADELLECALS